MCKKWYKPAEDRLKTTITFRVKSVMEELLRISRELLVKETQKKGPWLTEGVEVRVIGEGLSSKGLWTRGEYETSI